MFKELSIADICTSLIKYLLVFALGFLCCYIFYPRTLNMIEYRDKIIQGETKTITKTELAYIPKYSTTNNDGSVSIEKTDLEIKIPKQELNIKINGKDAIIKKSSDEAYLFEKNKVQLEQTSTAQINISVPVVDNTKHWSLGIGYGKNGLAGTVDFPLHKPYLSGWIYTDQHTQTLGIKIKF